MTITYRPFVQCDEPGCDAERPLMDDRSGWYSRGERSWCPEHADKHRQEHARRREAGKNRMKQRSEGARDDRRSRDRRPQRSSDDGEASEGDGDKNAADEFLFTTALRKKITAVDAELEKLRSSK